MMLRRGFAIDGCLDVLASIFYRLRLLFNASWGYMVPINKGCQAERW